MIITEKVRRQARRIGKQFNAERRMNQAALETINDRRRWAAAKYSVRDENAKRIAKEAQVRERSDPFVYNRVYTHLMRGIYSPMDYGASF